MTGLEQRLERLQREQKTGQVHLCFRSKRLFHAQFHRKENGFQSHQEWKQAWTEARSRQFFIIGSKDEASGCQGCVAIPEEDGSYSLRVRLRNAAKEKHLLITGVRFRYGQVFVLPGPVCNLNIVGESPARESLPEPFGKRPWNERVGIWEPQMFWYTSHFCRISMTSSDRSSARNSGPFSECLPIVVWVEPRGGSAAYYVDTKDVTADPSRGIADAHEQHRGAEAQYPVVAIIDERLPISMIEQVRELIGKAGFTNVRYFLTSPGSRSIGEISFGQVVGVADVSDKSSGPVWPP